MARQRKEPKSAKDIKLKQPDRSGPTEKTLLEMASERNLFDQADARQRQLRKEARAKAKGSDDDSDSDSEEEDDDEAKLTPGAERFLEAMLWTFSLAIVNFTFEVLVQNQYGMDVDWPGVWGRTSRAWIFFFFLFYPLHPHEGNPILVPGIRLKYQHPIRQFIFFVISTVAGPYLLYISNEFGYLAVMKRAPPLGCLWLWAVIELDLLWATTSLTSCVVFAWLNGYAKF